MTKQDTRQIESADGERTRGFWTAHHLFRRFRYRTCVVCTASVYYDGIPDSIIQDFVGMSVVSEG